MAARGTDEKLMIIKKILETFEGSFVTSEGKELRIPVNDVEIKVAFTCAKDVIGGGQAPTSSMKAEEIDGDFPLPKGTKIEVTVTEDEKENLKKLMSALNL